MGRRDKFLETGGISGIHKVLKSAWQSDRKTISVIFNDRHVNITEIVFFKEKS